MGWVAAAMPSEQACTVFLAKRPERDCGPHPGCYIDAFEWVTLTSTLGMSQFCRRRPAGNQAAGIERSLYRPHQRLLQGLPLRQESAGEDRPVRSMPCTGTFPRHAEPLSANLRLGMVYRQLASMSRMNLLYL
jgi:hypothetical protein